MWTTKRVQPDLPGTSKAQIPGSMANPANAASSMRSSGSPGRDVAHLGAGLVVKGEISGDEDLQIDGTVEGTISLQSHRLTVGRNGQLKSDVVAREVVIYGKVDGTLRVRERVEIKKDGAVAGVVATARISIEDGAYFSGRIEIDRGNRPMAEDLEAVRVPVATSTI